MGFFASIKGFRSVLVFPSYITYVTCNKSKLLINQGVNDAYLSETNVTPKLFHRILITSSTCHKTITLFCRPRQVFEKNIYTPRQDVIR